MPVPSNISDLSKVASENSPAGTESAKGTIDDYLRAHASFVRQLFDQLLGPSVVLASAPTVNIGFAASANIVITGTIGISAFDSAAEGTMRWITFSGALTLTHQASSFQLPGATNIVTTAGDVAVFKSLGSGNWKCMAYQRATGTGPHVASAARNGYLLAADWTNFNSKYAGNNPSGFISGINSAMVIAALGYTPPNPAGGLSLAGDLDARDITARGGSGAEGGRLYMSRALDNAPTHFWQTYGSTSNPDVRLATPSGQVVTISGAGNLQATVVTETSDERKKKSWARLPSDLIERLAGIKKAGTFRWKKGGEAAVGIGAQSLEAILPEAVYTDDKGHKAVNTGGAAMAIIPELARELVRMRARLAKLEAQ